MEFVIKPTTSSLIIEWYDPTRGLCKKSFHAIQFETIRFASGYLQWEDDEGTIQAFAHHEPFWWTIEHAVA